MSDLPTYTWPFVLAVAAALAGRFLAGGTRDEPRSLPAWILYAVAIGCVVIGLATMWLSQKA